MTVRRPSLDAVRGFDRAVYAIAFAQLVNVFGSGLVYPFATIHFHLTVGIPLAVVGLGLGVRSGATALGTAIGGYLADHIGRKPVMVGSMASSAVTLAAFAFVPSIASLVPVTVTTITGASAAGVVFVGVAGASGLTVGLYAPAGQAMTADLTAGEDRDRGYALLKFANNLGFGAGFVAGGVLYTTTGAGVFIADGLTSGVVAGILLASVPRLGNDGSVQTPDTQTGENIDRPGADSSPLREWFQSVTRPRVLGLAVLNIGFAAMYAQMQATVPVVAKEKLALSSAQIGTLYVLNPLTLVIFQLPLVDAISDWRRTRGLVVSIGLWALSMIAAWGADVGVGPVTAGVVLVGVHLVVRTLGEVLHSPLVTALMSDLGTTDGRGSQLSLLEIAKRIGMGLGAFVGGLFFDAGLSMFLWPLLIGVCLCVAGGLIILERRVSPKENGFDAVPSASD